MPFGLLSLLHRFVHLVLYIIPIYPFLFQTAFAQAVYGIPFFFFLCPVCALCPYLFLQ